MTRPGENWVTVDTTACTPSQCQSRSWASAPSRSCRRSHANRARHTESAEGRSPGGASPRRRARSRPTSPAMCGGCGGRGCRRAVAEWRIRLLPGRTGRADQARYWMISSARTRIDCGMVNPRALAVLRLRIISNFVGCSIGKSPGFAPFTIRSTYVAARRNRS
jgi:hypothetical protein